MKKSDNRVKDPICLLKPEIGLCRAAFDRFYFNPETYAMEIYQFLKNGEENTGEYILLSGMETVNGIKMPKTRAWYYNKNDKYLGTDILKKKR